jgi:hypothetical protein
MSCCVYFIEIDGYVKIGFSQNVIKRFRQINMVTPYEPKLLGVMDGGRDKEMELHKKFSRLHVRNEWFLLAGEIREFIEQNCRILVVPKAMPEKERRTLRAVTEEPVERDPYYSLQFYLRDSDRERARAEINERLRRIRKLEEDRAREQTA